MEQAQRESLLSRIAGWRKVVGDDTPVHVYECRRHGYFFAAFTPEQWRFLTGGRITCDQCDKPGMYHPELTEEP